jgi:DNA replication protein DnaC
MRRYERASPPLTSNCPVENWGKLLGDAAAVGAMLDRILHHGLCSSAALEVGEPS